MIRGRYGGLIGKQMEFDSPMRLFMSMILSQITMKIGTYEKSVSGYVGQETTENVYVSLYPCILPKYMEMWSMKSWGQRKIN